MNPEINNDYFKKLRDEIRIEETKYLSFAYQYDQNIRLKIKLLRENYDLELKTLVADKKNQMALELFTRSLNIQIDYLERIIKKFKLEKYLDIYDKR